MDHLVPPRVAEALRAAGLRPAGPLGRGASARWTALDPDGGRWAVTEVPSAWAVPARERAERLGRLTQPYLAQAGPVLELPGGDVAVLVGAEPGTDLDLLLAAREPLDEAEARGLLVPLAGALAALHAAGLAHGGLGCEDVVLTEHGPVLTDHGDPRRGAAADPAQDVAGLARIGLRLLGDADGRVAEVCRDPGPEAGALADRLGALGPASPVAMPDPAVLAGLALRRLAGAGGATGHRRRMHRARPRRRVGRAATAGAAVLVAALLVLAGSVAVRGSGAPAANGAGRSAGVAGVALAGAERAAVRLTEQRLAAQATGDVTALAGLTEPGSPAALADEGLPTAPVDLVEADVRAGTARWCALDLVCVPVTTTTRVAGGEPVTSAVTLVLRSGSWRVVSVGS